MRHVVVSSCSGNEALRFGEAKENQVKIKKTESDQIIF